MPTSYSDGNGGGVGGVGGGGAPAGGVGVGVGVGGVGPGSGGEMSPPALNAAGDDAPRESPVAAVGPHLTSSFDVMLCTGTGGTA